MDLFTLFIVLLLITLSGLFSGLTLGLMGLGTQALRRKARLGNPHAKAIYPVRKHGNLLLTTLLLGNVIVNSILAVFLGDLTTGLIAVIITTGLIVVFGEVLPQAVISRHALRYGSKFIFLVRIFIVVLYPIAKPIAWSLDRMLGRELPNVVNKDELTLILKEQVRIPASDVDKDDYKILTKSLVFGEQLVKDIMTPIKQVFHLSPDTKLSVRLLHKIKDTGYSRIPVMKDGKTVGILYAKDLITHNPNSAGKVKNAMRKKVVRVSQMELIDKVLNVFRKKRVHLFVVRNHKDKDVGVITLEDVLEELVGEVDDEYDN